MDYEKEYKEARDRAIKVIMKCRALSTEANLAVSYALSYVFPTTAEAEDEDERIRKALVAYFSDTGCDTIQGVRIKKVLAYLEKQKEQKPAKWSEEYNETNVVQPHWKPSEEQMSILAKVFAGCELNTQERDSMVDLFNNLKQMI